MKKLLAGLLILFIPALSYAQTQTAYNPGKATKYDIGQGSNVNFDLNIRHGTSGAHIFFGTETCNGVGTTGVVVGLSSAAPQIEFTYSGGTSTLNIKNTNVQVNSLALATLGTAIASASGAGSDTTLTNPNIEGSMDIGTTSSINANGVNISDDELSFLNNLYGNVQNQLDTKVGSTTPRVAVITCGGTSTAGAAGSSTVRIQGGGDLSTVMTDNGGGLFTITATLTGTPTAKPDVYEGTQSVVLGATEYHFGSETFKITQSGGGVNIDSTPVCAYGYAWRTSAQIVNNGTWTNVGLDSDNGELLNISHAGTNTHLIALKAGLYKAEGFISSRTSAGSVGIRICKNNGNPIPGSFAIAYQNYGDTNSSVLLKTPSVHFRMTLNDYIYMQVAHNTGSSQTVIDYAILGAMPSPGTASAYAGLAIERIGD